MRGAMPCKCAWVSLEFSCKEQGRARRDLTSWPAPALTMNDESTPFTSANLSRMSLALVAFRFRGSDDWDTERLSRSHAGMRCVFVCVCVCLCALTHCLPLKRRMARKYDHGRKTRERHVVGRGSRRLSERMGCEYPRIPKNGFRCVSLTTSRVPRGGDAGIICEDRLWDPDRARIGYGREEEGSAGYLDGSSLSFAFLRSSRRESASFETGIA